MKIRIGSHEVGDGCPPFIIAEIGSNWTNLDDCLHSIRQAKLCGADAAKFQLFTDESLYGIHGHRYLPKGEYFDGHASNPPYLPHAWLPHLKAECDRVGIEFMCSAFSPDLVTEVNKYVNVHKVASAECTHVRILEKLREFGKPVFLSTGAHGSEDIRWAINTLSWDKDHKRSMVSTVLLYCVAAYPTGIYDLRNVRRMREDFLSLVGLSDHTLDISEVPSAAVAREGACVLEKHVTFIDSQTPDSPHSLNADLFKIYVKAAKGLPMEIMSGPTIEEKPMILRHNRRLIATTDIPKGGILKEDENFGIYRSLKDDTHAFTPFMINEVNGRTTLKDIKAGDGIGPGDI